MPLAAWLLAIAWPIAKKVLAGLGIGWLTYEGVTAALNAVIGAVQANWGAVSGSILQIASLGGIPEVMGIICGALVARLAIATVARLGKVATS
jgi:Protein of unknown function (DUF2523)